jgi:hypothetical protein
MLQPSYLRFQEAGGYSGIDMIAAAQARELLPEHLFLPLAPVVTHGSTPRKRGETEAPPPHRAAASSYG